MLGEGRLEGVCQQQEVCNAWPQSSWMKTMSQRKLIAALVA
jgi:hypothetical protein